MVFWMRATNLQLDVLLSRLVDGLGRHCGVFGCFSALSALSVSETGRKIDKALLVEGHHNTVLLYFIQASWQGALHSQCSVLSPDCQCISYIHRAVLFTRLPSP